jgi:hypothetical protein
MDVQGNLNRNWTDEEKKLSDGSKYFKPQADTAYSVTFLDEGSAEYERKPFEGQSNPKKAIDFCVRVTGGGMVATEQIWTVTKGAGVKTSLYGMLVTLFARNGGKSTNLTVDIAATGKDKDRRYQIKQYNDLVFQKK